MAPDIEAVAEQVFVALADPTRRTILAALATDGPSTVTDLAGKLPITRQAIAKHLRVLADAGFVAGERRGREHIWRLRPQRLRDVHAQLDRISRQWEDALERLRAFVEDPPA